MVAAHTPGLPAVVEHRAGPARAQRIAAANTARAAKGPIPASLVPHAWKPGQSGNPAGRSPGLARLVRERLGKNGEKVIAFLESVLDGTATAEELAVVREGPSSWIERQPVGPTMHERIEAAKILLDRGFGRPALSLEVSGPDGGPIQTRGALDVAAYSDEQLSQLEGLLQAGARPALTAGVVVEGEIIGAEGEGESCSSEP